MHMLWSMELVENRHATSGPERGDPPEPQRGRILHRVSHKNLIRRHEHDTNLASLDGRRKNAQKETATSWLASHAREIQGARRTTLGAEEPVARSCGVCNRSTAEQRPCSLQPNSARRIRRNPGQHRHAGRAVCRRDIRNSSLSVRAATDSGASEGPGRVKAVSNSPLVGGLLCQTAVERTSALQSSKLLNRCEHGIRSGRLLQNGGEQRSGRVGVERRMAGIRNDA